MMLLSTCFNCQTPSELLLAILVRVPITTGMRVPITTGMRLPITTGMRVLITTGMRVPITTGNGPEDSNWRPVIPPVHWKGVALPRQRSSRTLKTLSNCKGFYSVFSAVERFLYLRDFFYYFDRFFNLCLRDFLNKFCKDF